MKDNTMVLQDNLNSVVSGVQALALLSKMIHRNDDGKLIEKDDVTKIFRQLSEALMSTQKNNLDTSCPFTKNLPDKDVLIHNIQCSMDGNDIDDDDVPMSTDAESCDSDNQSEPDIDYQEELLSRMMYYGTYDTTETQTPVSEKTPVSTTSSTPLASSTMLKECTNSMIRNNNRRRNRSTPLASSTMMEDLIAGIQEQQAENGSSIETWSIDDNTASVNEYYRRRFEMSSYDSSDSDGEHSTTFYMPTNADLPTIFNSDDSFNSSLDSDMSTECFFNSNNIFPRTSTSSDLLRNTSDKSKDIAKDKKKKKSNSKQPMTRLLFIIRNIKRNLSKKRSSKKNSRRWLEHVVDVGTRC